MVITGEDEITQGVGPYFLIFQENGFVLRQGKITEVHEDGYTVEFFSWFDRGLGAILCVAASDTKAWQWFADVDSWRAAGAREIEKYYRHLGIWENYKPVGVWTQ